ncbi:enoyl-CoA hydratase/isomerase family protein [Streptomyces sp. NPDC101234]|uniref:enoyl-CoA hydratase/isomerase family protein n=1 Tax=Streptomyces sp. NPDC101234 TaxID=3366138 RepID=UPI0038140D47
MTGLVPPSEGTMTTTQPAADAPAAVLERHGHTALITFNRPRALNAVNAELSAAAGAALEEFAADPDLRVAVLTGAGRAFCAGMDLKAAAAGLPVIAPGHEEWGFGGVVNHWVDKPLIAALNGPAFGGGAEIVLACDLAVADENATIGLPEVRRGLIPGAGGAIRLPRVIPRSTALEMLLTGEPITAATAERRGLVNRVAPVGSPWRPPWNWPQRSLPARPWPLVLSSASSTPLPASDPTGKPTLGPPTTPSGSESAPVWTPRRVPEPSWRSASRAGRRAEASDHRLHRHTAARRRHWPHSAGTGE